jgi:hypothetical protein
MHFLHLKYGKYAQKGLRRSFFDENVFFLYFLIDEFVVVIVWDLYNSEKIFVDKNIFPFIFIVYNLYPSA